MPGIVMPQEIHGLLRKRLTDIDPCDSAVNCLVAQARAEGLVESLEILKAISAQTIERLYLMIEEAALARLANSEARHIKEEKRGTILRHWMSQMVMNYQHQQLRHKPVIPWHAG
ncbi:hypothetical protein IAE35_02305 [Pseudomonas sp. S75]|uniref:hypothetical protein n=1 Tax=unclassified Pseudomonas TaxID=196821 RepID=UPI0019082184|nr:MULTISPECIES: hypothetical protein [unclassified Pseudomonas]MBJ9973912.1 hypothetical protein [Pseudomonas sp. S30]MBK0152158.1 hypothetical protein [Pseudomonas sp. S75]